MRTVESVWDGAAVVLLVTAAGAALWSLRPLRPVWRVLGGEAITTGM